MYNVIFNEDAKKDVLLLQRSCPSAMPKLAKLLDELREHPRMGTGRIEQLKHYKEETWSRRITKEHRLVYRIYDNIVEVLVLSTFGHYN